MVSQTRPRIAVVTATGVGADDVDHPHLAAALEARGLDHRLVVWDDPQVDWSTFDMALLRSTWDYTLRLGEFLDWMHRAAGLTRVVNPVPVVEWNADKHYLSELAAAGIPTVPTEFVEVADDIDRAIGAASSMAGVAEIVVKPTVSAGSRNTARHGSRESAQRAVADLLSSGHSVMVQPYLSAIEASDETGVVLLDGEVSHGFAKGAMLTVVGRPPEPDARHHVRERVGPRIPRPAEIDLAERVATFTEERFGRLLYQRVDMVPGPEGPVIMEVELIEPSLFFVTDPAAADRYAALVARAVR